MQARFELFFRDAPAEVDPAAIKREWASLTPDYPIEARHLPLPVWARRGLTDDGPRAWSTLSQDVRSMDEKRAFCIYVHIPFCSSRCAFCDCYAFPLRRLREQHIEGYIDLLIQEAQLWSRLGTLARRPVSTVHLGGGTPTFIRPAALRRLVQALQARFACGPETEWALESSSSELDEEMLDALDELGFTRLHVGVQSLEDNVRRTIGRREQAAEVLTRIERAVARGWIVSVDLIVGLPGQTLTGALADVCALEAVGVDGFSVYELQLSSRNRRFAEAHGLLERDRLENYWLLQAVSRLLIARGYKKTLFNHFARHRDTNLYFTFPERGEDCLALGTIADGVWGDYHYRHPEYADYCRSVSPSFPGLQGGMRRTPLESRLFRLETALLSARFEQALFSEVLGDERAGQLFRRWQDAALIAQDPSTGRFHLTGNGSWFVAQMMAELAFL